jgi:hypothetical protein
MQFRVAEKSAKRTIRNLYIDFVFLAQNLVGLNSNSLLYTCLYIFIFFMSYR